MDTSLHSKLELARQDLLDLGLRNTLLNYRLLRARGVEVRHTNPDEPFDLLVREMKQLSFLPADEPQAVEEDTLAEESLALMPPSEEPHVSSNARRARSTKLQTAHAPSALQSRLLNTYLTAETFLEEQGVNTLFLAFGLLRWYEDDNSQEAHFAPLILVPVKLERNSATSSFHIQYTEDELGENASLGARIVGDFGLKLPPLPEKEDLSVEDYADQVRRVVAEKPRWQVDDLAIALGFFSFNKFLMYKDLDVESWPTNDSPLQHPILQALLDKGFHEPTSRFSDTDHLDAVLPPQESTNVVDADSSQVLAVADVNGGRNLVIQGPPGTGKSQTITNLIADAIANGRSVLFVSEKMAALQVVKHRLDQVGLGDACLELHSHKANKKAVLAELKRTVELGRPRLEDMADEVALLGQTCDRLNEYCEAVNAPVRSSGVTLYQVFGELLQQQSVLNLEGLPPLSLPECITWTSLEYKQKAALVQEFQAHLQTLGIPQNHRFWAANRTVFLPIEEDALRRSLTEARQIVERLRTASSTLAESLRLPQPATERDASTLARAARRAMDAPPLDGVRLNAGDWISRQADLKTLLAAGRQWAALHQEYSERLTLNAWDQDVSALRVTLAHYGSQWWRIFSGEYRAARKQLTGLCRAGAPKELAQHLALVDAIAQAQTARAVILQHTALAAALFGVQWQGEQSDWPVLTRLWEWIVQLYQEVGGGQLPRGLIDFLAGHPDLLRLESDVTATDAALSPFGAVLSGVVTGLPLDEALRFGPGRHLRDQPLGELEMLLADWALHLADLQSMTTYNALAQRCRDAKLSSVLETAETWPEAGQKLSAAFERTRLMGLTSAAYQDHPILVHFSSEGQENAVQTFRRLDRLVQRHNRARLAHSHWKHLPPQDGDGQLRVLSREFEKRTRHIPIRRLIAEAGRVVKAIKPVFMMSPLSVATYLSPGGLTFDLVVFDEASQVRPVDALGALLRGKQAVVVGDSRQLPPTSFFDTITSTEVVDEDNVTSDIESVLGLFAAQGAPQRMLKWHYRSRHESLIAVSNQLFYDNQLVIFPSPDAARQLSGLVYRHLPETAYDRGGSSKNVGEARVVAEAVMTFARTQLARSESNRLTLGVAAFSMAQMQAVYDQLEILRRQNPDCEPFFSPSARESFFVKNLENVQGDERDVIFISVGYGRTANGTLTMNFGPLNGQGGERRLNVLITRARLRCEVFTNLTPDDIDLNKTQARGVQAFKTFLAYARTGNLEMSRPSGRDPDSPFEREVIAALQNAGHEVVPQVGCAGYFIDMAVIDPERRGRYLLGIECDGATYHSARSARDRDRLREQVLVAQGWRLHHIWSTDWFRRPAAELRRVLLAIEEAKLAARLRDREESERSPDKADETGEPDAADKPYLTGEPPKIAGAPPRLGFRREERLKGETVIERTQEQREPRDTAAVLPYTDARREMPTVPYFNELTPSQLAVVITNIVKIESPIHRDELVRRVADLSGYSRAGSRIKRAVELGINAAVNANKIVLKGQFFWWPTMRQPPLRDRGALDGGRDIRLICTEEISLAIWKVIEDSYGMPDQDIASAVGRLFGFGRVTNETRSYIDEISRAMVSAGILNVNGSMVTTATTTTP